MNLHDFIYGYLKDYIQDGKIAMGLTNHIHYQVIKRIKRYSVGSFVLGILFTIILLVWLH
jgi:hypothetical protein